jgi:hypothetical protein
MSSRVHGSDLAGEGAFHDDALRARLCTVLAQQSTQFAKVVGLAPPLDEAGATDLGAFLLAARHGTLLRMKVERNATALVRFRRMLARLLDPTLKRDDPGQSTLSVRRVWAPPVKPDLEASRIEASSRDACAPLGP